jgi:hypothetical protein
MILSQLHFLISIEIPINPSRAGGTTRRDSARSTTHHFRIEGPGKHDRKTQAPFRPVIIVGMMIIG